MNQKIIIYSHNSGVTGSWDDELFKFLKCNNNNIIKVVFPFGKNSIKSIRIVNVRNSIETGKFEAKIKFSTPEILSYLKDFFYGLIYGFKFSKGTFLFFGLDNLLALIGLFFKKIKFIKKVAYVIYDYTPVRFNNRFINNIYNFVDKICLYNSDYILPLSLKMIEGRIKDHNLNRSYIKRIIESPFGNNSLKRKKTEYMNYDKNILVYFGDLIRSKGIELFVPIALEMLNRKKFDFRFYIIGGGEIEYLIINIKKYNLDNYFKIYGSINNHITVEKILMTCGIAIAPYSSNDKNNFSFYADPGKVKFYLGCGLPIVITDVPPIAKDIEKNQSGLIAEYNSVDFCNKIICILDNYDIFKNNAIEFGKIFDWNLLFGKSLKNIV
jgi:glycosyltransferase involved in cell wall biosynthesis